MNNRDKRRKVGQGLQLKIRDNGNTAKKRKKHKKSKEENLK